jgi:hypothetical protein
MSGFIHLGSITIDAGAGPRDYEIWSIGDPDASWERTRLHYFPYYDGPEPTKLEYVRERLLAQKERRLPPNQY